MGFHLEKQWSDLQNSKALAVHGLIKKVNGTYKYYLIKLGKSVITTGLRVKK